VPDVRIRQEDVYHVELRALTRNAVVQFVVPVVVPRERGDTVVLAVAAPVEHAREFSDAVGVLAERVPVHPIVGPRDDLLFGKDVFGAPEERVQGHVTSSCHAANIGD